MNRDIETITPTKTVRFAKRIVVAIGIDHYEYWPRLSNAVNDADAALAAFVRMGFEPLMPPIVNEHATAEALRGLIADSLSELKEDDQLVVFFAGHGHTETRLFSDGDSVKTGYVIPVDANLPDVSRQRWLRIDSWLSDISRLAARHILVFLDACHSGIALGTLIKTRDLGVRREPFSELQQRRSRRVITSALDGQTALDSGPMPRQSLFTGWLLEALNGGIADHGTLVSGSELGGYIQRMVTRHSGAGQTPDFGALEEDRRGELVFKISTVGASLAMEKDRQGYDVVRLDDLTPETLDFARLALAARRLRGAREALLLDARARTLPELPTVNDSPLPGVSATIPSSNTSVGLTGSQVGGPTEVKPPVATTVLGPNIDVGPTASPPGSPTQAKKLALVNKLREPLNSLMRIPRVDSAHTVPPSASEVGARRLAVDKAVSEVRVSLAERASQLASADVQTTREIIESGGIFDKSNADVIGTRDARAASGDSDDDQE